jgi:hypothetical protein
MAEENKLSKNSFAENFAKLLTDKFFDKKDELKDFSADSIKDDIFDLLKKSKDTAKNANKSEDADEAYDEYEDEIDKCINAVKKIFNTKLPKEKIPDSVAKYLKREEKFGLGRENLSNTDNLVRLYQDIGEHIAYRSYTTLSTLSEKSKKIGKKDLQQILSQDTDEEDIPFINHISKIDNLIDYDAAAVALAFEKRRKNENALNMNSPYEDKDDEVERLKDIKDIKKAFPKTFRNAKRKFENAFKKGIEEGEENIKDGHDAVDPITGQPIINSTLFDMKDAKAIAEKIDGLNWNIFSAGPKIAAKIFNQITNKDSRTRRIIRFFKKIGATASKIKNSEAFSNIKNGIKSDYKKIGSLKSDEVVGQIRNLTNEQTINDNIFSMLNEAEDKKEDKAESEDNKDSIDDIKNDESDEEDDKNNTKIKNEGKIENILQNSLNTIFSSIEFLLTYIENTYNNKKNSIYPFRYEIKNSKIKFGLQENGDVFEKIYQIIPKAKDNNSFSNVYTYFYSLATVAKKYTDIVDGVNKIDKNIIDKLSFTTKIPKLNTENFDKVNRNFGLFVKNANVQNEMRKASVSFYNFVKYIVSQKDNLYQFENEPFDGKYKAIKKMIEIMNINAFKDSKKVFDGEIKDGITFEKIAKNVPNTLIEKIENDKDSDENNKEKPEKKEEKPVIGDDGKPINNKNTEDVVQKRTNDIENGNAVESFKSFLHGKLLEEIKNEKFDIRKDIE